MKTALRLRGLFLASHGKMLWNKICLRGSSGSSICWIVVACRLSSFGCGRREEREQSFQHWEKIYLYSILLFFSSFYRLSHIDDSAETACYSALSLSHIVLSYINAPVSIAFSLHDYVISFSHAAQAPAHKRASIICTIQYNTIHMQCCVGNCCA